MREPLSHISTGKNELLVGIVVCVIYSQKIQQKIVGILCDIICKCVTLTMAEFRVPATFLRIYFFFKIRCLIKISFWLKYQTRFQDFGGISNTAVATSRNM